MEELLDEDGRARAPSRPTAKKDGLNDPALADPGPDLDSPEVSRNRDDVALEAVDDSEAVSMPSGVAPTVVGIRPNIALGSDLNPGDRLGPVLAPNPDIVAPLAGSLSDGTLGVDSGPGDGVVQNPDMSEELETLEMVQDGGSQADGQNGDENPRQSAPNRDNVAPLAGNLRDGTLGVDSGPGDGAVQIPGVNEESEILEMEQDGGSHADGQNGDENLHNSAPNPDMVAPLARNLSGDTLGVDGGPGDRTVQNPDMGEESEIMVEMEKDVGSQADTHDGDENPRNSALNPDNLAPHAGSFSDGTLGVDGGPDDGAVQNSGMGEAPEIVEMEEDGGSQVNGQNGDKNPCSTASNPNNVSSLNGTLGLDGRSDNGAVPNPGMAGKSEILEMKEDGGSQANDYNGDENSGNSAPTTNTDAEVEILWSTAVAEQDCIKLTDLLAKDVTYFWKYEKKHEVGTALHAAAAKGDLELAEYILILLSCSEEVGYHDIRFSDTRLNIDDYVKEEKDAQGKTAEVVAHEKNHDAIENRICDYIRDEDQRRMNEKKRNGASTRTGSSGKRASPEILKWNDAIKRKDCLALLEIFPKSNWESWSNVEKSLIRELEKVETKNGKGGRRTALQVTAMQGCFKLAKLLLDHMYFLPVLYYFARDEASGLSAFEMANDVIGNKSITQYIKTHAMDSNIGRLLHLNKGSNTGWGSRFFGAYPGSRWYRALEQGDARELKKLMELNSRFILETCDDLTVLHVAILWNDLNLVKEVRKLFGNAGIKIEWGESYYPDKISLNEMMDMEAKNIDHALYWEDSSARWQPLTNRMLKELKRDSSVRRLAEVLERTEFLSVLDGGITFSPTSNGEYLVMPLGIHEFLTKHWMPAYDEGFHQDVDFNFEGSTQKEWLKFHYACKHPLQFEGFLHQMAFYIKQHPNDAAKLLQMWDGKGRTPFHILMDHHNDEKDPGWPFDEIFNHGCFKEWIQIVESSRGKRIIDIILIKNYLQRNVVLHPWTYFKVNLNYEKFERLEVKAFLYYQVAYFLKQKNFVQELWSRFFDKKGLTNVMRESQDAINSMFFLAASTGNHTCLQLLLEVNHDPMIIDSNGRSLLHHAADPTTLLPQLLAHCSLTVEDVLDVRRKYMDDDTIYDPQPSSSMTCAENFKGMNTMQQNGSNSSTKKSTTNSNDAHTLQRRTLDISLGERSNVGRKACILMLLQAGVDLGQPDNNNKVPTIGPTIDATYQSWWYDMVVKDSTDKKQALSQAGSALSVVGTLVAATSYVGPLQPPLSFDSISGFVQTNKLLIKVFMVSNSVAFYLAMASVMFAVVSSLPMPQEGVMSELNRAKHVISFSLCLLQIAIGSIIISYATASIVVIQNEHVFHPSDLLFSPSIIGWFFCFLGIGGFLIRLARLIFYRNQTVRNIYQFSFSKNILVKCPWVIAVCLFGIIVYYPLYTILVCLEKISSKIPLLERRDIDYYFWRLRSRLRNFFINVRRM